MNGEAAVVERDEEDVYTEDESESPVVVSPPGSKFDASRYLTDKVRGGQPYLETKYKLLWLRTDHPDAVILTEIVKIDTEKGLAVFKASVTIPEKGSATGYGSETAKDFGDFIEKAETKAIGRALSHLGYGTQFAESEAGIIPNVTSSGSGSRGGGSYPSGGARGGSSGKSYAGYVPTRR